MIKINLLATERKLASKKAAFDPSQQITVVCGVILIIAGLAIGGGGTAGVLRRRRRPVEAETDVARAILTRRGLCRACLAAETVERRETELLHVLLGDRRVAERYAVSHGICVHHALAASPDAPAADPLRGRTIVRLQTIAWELDELQRKGGWDFRHESPGPEATAARRALAQVDGRVFLGAPAEVVA